ncbi:hypothetical protein [Ferrovibrio sp.]|uniref:hypothetical protein n=1 Tax=Ferrovibrio sp. TaxID=1917215 RepID=UPI003519C90B
MAGVELELDDLLLDLENPRISKADSQRGALQKIIEDQDAKLVVLAESIVADRLNPMDRWLVQKSPVERGRYIVLEGNRRLAALRILNNPAVLKDLEVRAPIKRRFEELAEQFDLAVIEPIDCYEVADRSDGATWLNQRHTGENRGRGIVNWGGVATARFRGRDPALQALDFVISHGGLSEDEKAQVEDHFPISTLDRLLSTPSVRKKIGIEITESKLMTSLPPTEVIKPLRRIVLDLANEVINVTKIKSKDQQVAYVGKLGKDLPDLGKQSSELKPVERMEDQDFRQPRPKPKPKPKPIVRKALIPRDCYLTVSNAKIAEIVKELRGLPLEDYPHSISVLFRVFLEQSTDHYLDVSGIVSTIKTPNGKKDKSLRAKVGDAIEHMVKSGTARKNLAGVLKGIDDKTNPLFVDTLHNYVHNRFLSPTERDLKVAWDNAQIYFETIWK